MIKINYKILVIDIILLGVIILIFLSCQCNDINRVNAKEQIAYCLKKCEFPQIHNYIIIDSTKDESSTDELIDFTLKINKSDFFKLVDIIKSKPYFKKYDSLYSIRSAYDTNSDWSRINEAAFLYKEKIYFERFDPKIGEVIRVVLIRDSLLTVELQYL